MRYRKKPVIIEAVQFTGFNLAECMSFIKGTEVHREILIESNIFTIDTLEGQMTASIGDYIIKGVNGEFYPCKPDIFKKTYEEVGPGKGPFNPPPSTHRMVA
jgi:hypothetical protein